MAQSNANRRIINNDEEVYDAYRSDPRCDAVSKCFYNFLVK